MGKFEGQHIDKRRWQVVHEGIEGCRQNTGTKRGGNKVRLSQPSKCRGILIHKLGTARYQEVHYAELRRAVNRGSEHIKHLYKSRRTNTDQMPATSGRAW